jgi:hypothetical protein
MSGLQYPGVKDIAEVIVYDRELTNGERDQVYNYLKTKYAL